MAQLMSHHRFAGPSTAVTRFHESEFYEHGGRYKVSQARVLKKLGRTATLFALALAWAAVPGFAQEDPVEVEFDVAGDAVPGGTVTVTANITINDGSSLQGQTWTQVGGVEAALSGTSSSTVTAVLGTEEEYKEMLLHVLNEPPLSEDQLPPNVPPPEGEFPAGLQSRFEVVGIDPFSLEHAEAVVLELEVRTTSGTYVFDEEILAHLHYAWTSGIRTVPIGVTVLLNGKDQESYDWLMTLPPASSAELADADTRNPEFVPDVPGLYRIDVTDIESGETVTLRIYGGTYRGVIVGQDEDGRPVSDPACLSCHNDSTAPDKFSEWAQTGHAEIFKDMLNTNTHYSTGCFACHTVGFYPNVDNGGIDEADDYLDFLMELDDLESPDAYDPNATYGIHADPENWNTVVDDFSHTAQLGNIQCENCHGPQDSIAHSNGDPRITLSSSMCAVCHGEPPRHGRFQQWQLSAHANYELAIDEGESEECSRCHTANGFIQWVEEYDADPEAEVEITWTPDEVHPQTCQACHDPHDIGTVSGDSNNATVRVVGDTAMLVAGFQATDVGSGAVCMTCHNSRRGLRNDSTFEQYAGTSEAARAPHPGAQTDVLMGQNAYFVKTGTRGMHSNLEDTCADCHMQATPPPDIISYNNSGTNHTFYASPEICADCHQTLTAESVQEPFEEALEELLAEIEAGYMRLVEGQLGLGRSIDVNGDAVITDFSQIEHIEFYETRGRQALTFYLGGEPVGPHRIPDIDVIPGSGDAFSLDTVADRRLLKAGWNYLLLHADGSHGVHNPRYATAILEASESAMMDLEAGVPDVVPGAPGEGQVPGAVACVSSHVYWTEIAAHIEGDNDSVWRTDVSARNLATSAAGVEFVLHTGSGDVTSEESIPSGAQGVFEDVVGAMGVEDGKGALEICSDQPLEVVARIFNQSPTGGTFGQFLYGYPGGAGLAVGQGAQLLGLRQQEGAFRTNISVTNTGLDTAAVRITLFANNGTELHSYTLEVGSGMVYQDTQPFKRRAGRPNLGFGYAVVEVTQGYGVLTSASVIDDVTNDATTILMKQ
jgi:hypothetical protein